MDLRLFRTVADEVPILMASSALEGQLFIIKFLVVGPVSHGLLDSFR